MTKLVKARIKTAIIVIVVLSCASIMIFLGARDNIVFFYTPSELHENIKVGKIKEHKKVRVGGMVMEGSILKTIKKNGSLETVFTVTDYSSELKISYVGILPQLFKSGQGVVADGFYNNKEKIFIAKKMLFKHDEKYVPPEIKNIHKK